ncbi:hypothetical protein BGZ65_008374 [Modicella reniformis]|uniref:Uncharacterized protein n=1 Tax=Modicella reniformis TaxID=1440133 RepID=A0A9P6JGR3_9FUNG|nr:hypothetical protein BGZ65_008374 [Modicella reniformis]
MSVSWSPSPLIPPFRFGTVEPDLYRGAYPKKRNLRFLKRLKLRTILSLIPDAPDEALREFCTQHGIRSIHLPVDKVKDNVPLTYNRAVEALQTWNVSSAMGEFLRFLRGGVISSEEAVFVEKFSSEIEISKPIPPWLWEGQITFKKHPTLKVNFTLPPASAAPVLSNSANGTVSSPNLSSSSSPSTVVVLPSQQNDNSGAIGSSSATSVIVDVSNASAGEELGGRSVGGSGSTTSPSGSNAVSTSLPSPKPRQLSNHASRSSAKGGLRDRASYNKNIIRTDVLGSSGYGSSKSTSITTPTIAALAQNRRGMMTGLTASNLPQQQGRPQDSLAIESAGSSSLGIRVSSPPSNSISHSRAEIDRTSAGATVSQSSMGSHGISVAHNEHGSNVDAEKGPGKDGLQSGIGQKVDENSSNSSAIPAQERASNPPTTIKNSPVATPTVTGIHEEEYYEVSMTLKALSLEGADF